MRIDDIDIEDADIFEILLDSFPDMIHSIDDEGNIVYTNRTAESLLGYSRDELLKMNIRSLYADSVLEAVENGFSNLKKEGGWSGESMLKAKDGTEIPVEIRSFSIYDDNGSFVRTFSILRDIREVKELQQSLVHAGRLAAIGELSSGVAHDINNPLTVILLSNEMVIKELDRDSHPSEKAVQHIKSHALSVKKASHSIQKLADHLRNFSRGMAEKYCTVDLYDSIEDSLFIASNKVIKSGVNVINDVQQGKYFVNGAMNQLEQVIVNLITNACDAMEEREKRELEITVESYKLEDVECWKCDISDTGSGIPAKLIDDVFQSFFTTKEKGKGTGLGLSISRGIITEHDGDLRVSSKEGEGTTFSIMLPKIQK